MKDEEGDKAEDSVGISAHLGNSARPLPKYRCHKEVSALKIAHIEGRRLKENEENDGFMLIVPAELGYGSFWVDHEYVRRHKPHVGGYYVVYKDGYKSFSPAEAFEEGYTRI